MGAANHRLGFESSSLLHDEEEKNMGEENMMENIELLLGKIIESIGLGSDDALHFVLTDGSKVKLWDDEGLCCERRYMTCDDDLSYFVGSKILNVDVKEVSKIDDHNEDVHEIQFLEVMTDRGCFTIATHNEHNGYYGGFYVRVEAE